MNDVEKSIALYTAIAERCEKNGLSNRQAAVYREMIDFMKDCDTVEAMSAKIKNSKYYTAPAVALILDRLDAHKKAAEEEEMPEIAEVYRKKMEEIKADVAAMYVTGYEVTARNYKAKYMSTLDAFGRIYRAYMAFVHAMTTDKTEKESALKDMREAMSNLTLPSDDFLTLARLPKFRKLIATTDVGYGRFVQAVPKILNGEMDLSDEAHQEEQIAEAEWKEISQNKAQILEMGKENLQRIRRAKVTVIAPENAKGQYRYVDEEVH